MEISNLIPHIESLIFASDKPLTSLEITELINQAFSFMEDKIGADQVDAAIEGIVEKYATEFYPFEVRQSGGGWQFLTKKEYHKTVAQLNGEKFLKRLSSATLETLAIIAYKQPITKGEIESIRGVSTDYSVQKLLEKELIIISGRNEKLPGHPLIYETSKSFMDYFGINSSEDLPKIREVLSDQVVQATIVNHTEFEEGEVLAVSDDGELINALTTEDEAPAVNGRKFNSLPGDALEEENVESENEITSDETIDEASTGNEENLNTNDLDIDAEDNEGEIKEEEDENDNDAHDANDNDSRSPR
ncbi:MAG TPA: SMC-Scp complex subunit ScpB [Flavisolibacter sp.]|nr:SMC-Scp complex subunit ScpB [Flavisolibacter sp.]